MSWQMPAPPDKLVQLLRRQSPMAPAGAVPPPTAAAPQPAPAFGPQPTPQTVAQNQAVEGGGQPVAQPVPQPQPTPQAPAAPPPSDDPSLAPVKTPDLTNYLNPIMQQQQALNAKRAAVPDIDPNAVKPKLWERLLGIALGATQLKNPENAGAVADRVVNRRLYGAEQARNLALQPINEQQEALDKQMPLYTAAGRSAYEQAQLGLDTNRENRERSTAKGNIGFKSEWNDIRQQRADDQQKTAADRNQQQKDALEERERNDNARNSLTDRLRSLEEERKNNPDKHGTPGQFSGVEVKKQQALSKALSNYQNAVKDLSAHDLEGHKEAADNLASAQQQAQDAYEQEIIALGGSAEHVDLADKGKPKSNSPQMASMTEKTVTAKKVDTLGGHKAGDVVTLKGGQKVKIKQLYADGSFDHEPVSK